MYVHKILITNIKAITGVSLMQSPQFSAFHRMQTHVQFGHAYLGLYIGKSQYQETIAIRN